MNGGTSRNVINSEASVCTCRQTSSSCAEYTAQDHSRWYSQERTLSLRADCVPNPTCKTAQSRGHDSRSQDAIERSLEYSCPSDRNHLLSCMALYAALSPFLSVNATPSSTPHVVARWRSGHIVLHDRDTRLCAESRILVRNCPQAFLYTSAQRVFVLQFDQTKKGLEFLRKKKSAHQRIAPTARVDRWRA